MQLSAEPPFECFNYIQKKSSTLSLFYILNKQRKTLGSSRGPFCYLLCNEFTAT